MGISRILLLPNPHFAMACLCYLLLEPGTHPAPCSAWHWPDPGCCPLQNHSRALRRHGPVSSQGWLGRALLPSPTGGPARSWIASLLAGGRPWARRAFPKAPHAPSMPESLCDLPSSPSIKSLPCWAVQLVSPGSPASQPHELSRCGAYLKGQDLTHNSSMMIFLALF